MVTTTMGMDDHPSYVAHHFDTSQQQFDAGKLGIWLFLAQEVLFFSGLFVFYVYIKTLKPGAFEYAHSFLEVKYGLINTIVLITSSLTMAWGVRCASLNQKERAQAVLGLNASRCLRLPRREVHRVHQQVQPRAILGFRVHPPLGWCPW